MSTVKVISCKDAGYDCNFVARSESEDDLLAQVIEHSKKVHNMTNIDDAMLATIRSFIHEEATL